MDFIFFFTLIFIIIFLLVKNQGGKDQINTLMSANRNLIFQLDEKEKEYKIKIK